MIQRSIRNVKSPLETYWNSEFLFDFQMFALNILVTFVHHSLHILLLSFGVQEKIDKIFMVAVGSVRVLLPTGLDHRLESGEDWHGRRTPYQYQCFEDVASECDEFRSRR